MIDSEITKTVRNHIKRMEDNEMKATSVQNIKNIKDICFDVSNDPIERESKLTIVASTDDDIFAFEFEGPDLLQSCKRAGLFTGWEKDQKIRELEKELSDWKKEAADCLKLRDEAQKEAYKLKQTNDDLEQEREALLEENDKLRYAFDDLSEENKKLRKRIDTLKGRKQSTSKEEPADNVNHPSHYETGKYECIEVMQEVFGVDAVRDFCKCNAFKYIYRMDRKNGTEDVKKAIWYLNKYLELTEKEV